MGVNALELSTEAGQTGIREASAAAIQENRQRALNMAKYGCWQIQNMVANLISIGQLEKQPLFAQWETFEVEKVVREELQPLTANSQFAGKKLILHCNVERDFNLTAVIICQQIRRRKQHS